MSRISMARRVLAMSAATALGLTALAGTASADDIVNDLTGTVKQMALDPGATGTTTLSLSENNTDGENGCNLQGGRDGGDYVTFSVTSSDTSVATVLPATVTFDSCGDTHEVTVKALQPGQSNVTLTQTDVRNSERGTFNPAPAAFTVIVAGPTNTAPEVTVTGVEDGAAYAKGSVPVAMCEVRDAEDGPSTFPAELRAITGSYAADGVGEQTATCSYTDDGGLTETVQARYTIVDPTAPVVSGVVTSTAPIGLNGWYVSDVTLDWTVTEPESPNSLVLVDCMDRTINTDQQATNYSCLATSAGGSTEGTVSIKRDATPPTTPQFVGGPSGDIYFGDVVTKPTCTSSDVTSGLNAAGCVVIEEPEAAVGTHEFTAQAMDNAGNKSTSTLDYEVKAWTLNGFYKPVDMGGILNTVKAGSTVPLKFEVFAGQSELTSTSVVTSFVQKSIACEAGATTDDLEFTTTGGTTLRYDTTAGQFVQNWQTPKKPGACYQVTMTTQDGSTLVAKFKLR